MTQLSLVYDAAHAGADTWAEELRWLRKAVDVIGHKELAYKLDVQPSQLTDALLERERKDVKAKWLATALFMVPEALCREYLQIIARKHGYTVERIRTRTASEELRETREILKRVAPVALREIDEELGK